MSEADDLLHEAAEEAQKADEVIDAAERHREAMRRFRAKRKKTGRCQDCGAKIQSFSRCLTCRRKRSIPSKKSA